ncbi:MAG: DUF4159 domain-containing protein [Deltaproteobacteria bacterium]|nr:DUF4159 domain-containing protein [Deltaproteobacteria bacterium]
MKKTSEQPAEVTRRGFLGALLATGVLLHGRRLIAIGSSSQVDITQLIYSGGNWQPRPTALRRLAFELQKRTAVDAVLEPTSTRVLPGRLAASPLLYMSGDRSFTPLTEPVLEVLRRYLRLGGTLIIDPAYTSGGDANGFKKSMTGMLHKLLPGQSAEKIASDHVIFRSFYKLDRAVGLHDGAPWLEGYTVGDRTAVIVGDHDMGGAWARDNLGNWENEMPGGARQRERAFRMGVNLVMYALCGDYKNEMPHKRFSGDANKGAR